MGKGTRFERVVFKSGNSAAIRLPKFLGFEPGERLLAFVDGEALVLSHADDVGWPVGYFESWEAVGFELPERSEEGRRQSRLEGLFGERGGLS